MATAVSQLKIQLQGASTIEQLEETLDKVNNQIRQVDVNSQAFEELSAVARDADAQLRTVSDSLEGVTGQEQAESAKKLGEGLAGAFAAATVASSVFGEDTAESVEQATQTALQLVVVLDGLEKASQAFSAETVKGLRSIVTGFRSSKIAAKLFGTTTRAAISATGIGILVVLLGTLIANWDSVTEAASKFGSTVKETIDTSLPFLGSFIDKISILIDKVGSISNLFSALGDGISAAFTIGGNASNSFFDSLDKGRKLEDLQKRFEAVSAGVKLIVDNLTVIRDRSADITELSQRRVKELEREIKLTDNQFKKAELERELEIERLEIQANRLDLLNIQKDLLDDVLPETRELLKEDIKALELAKEQTEDSEKKLEFQEQINKLIDDRISLTQIERIVQEDINNIIFQQDLLNKNLSDEERARVLELQKLNNLLDDGLNTIRETNKERDKAKFDSAVQDVRDLLNEIDETEEAAKKLNAELNAFSEANQPPEEQVERFRLSILRAIKVQQDLNREAGKLPRQFETTGDQVEDFKIRASEAISFIGQQTIDALQAPITFIQGNIERLTGELERINELAEESTERRTELESQLEGAQGRRFDLILAKLRQEKNREEELAKQRIAQEEAIAEAKTNQAKLEKAQAIAQATIQALLSVVQALPNIPLSVLVGAIGGANIAAIASQRIPEFADGGYTGDGMGFRDSTGERVAGVVHENEYVIPKPIVASNPDMVATLEAMRTGKRRFADGGLVPQVSNDSGGFNSNSLINALGKARFQVSVNEFRDVSSEVDVIENNSSL